MGQFWLGPLDSLNGQVAMGGTELSSAAFAGILALHGKSGLSNKPISHTLSFTQKILTLKYFGAVLL
jgi:hypothetical protein